MSVRTWQLNPIGHVMLATSRSERQQGQQVLLRRFTNHGPRDLHMRTDLICRVAPYRRFDVAETPWVWSPRSARQSSISDRERQLRIHFLSIMNSRHNMQMSNCGKAGSLESQGPRAKSQEPRTIRRSDDQTIHVRRLLPWKASYVEAM